VATFLHRAQLNAALPSPILGNGRLSSATSFGGGRSSTPIGSGGIRNFLESNANATVGSTMEGKYLAHVLGDALVKGLTQVSQQRPPDPVLYLANFLRSYNCNSKGFKKPHEELEDWKNEKSGDEESSFDQNDENLEEKEFNVAPVHAAEGKYA